MAEDFDSPWGTPIIVRVTPADGKQWIGKFQAGGLGGVTGCFACPSPTDLCVVADGLAYLVNVTAPSLGASAVKQQIMQVVRVEVLPLFLLVSWTNILAIGESGVAWRTARIALDDLRVEVADARAIVCTGDMLGHPPRLELSPATGEQIGGTRFDSFWPPDATA